MTNLSHPSEGEIRAKYKDALAMCWWNDDTELLLLRGNREESYLGRHSWPDDTPFLQTNTDLWEAAWGLAAPLRAPYAAVAWIEQGASNVTIVDLNAMECIRGAQYTSYDVIVGLAFSPDDHLLVAVFESYPERDEDPPVPGQAVVGTVVITTVGKWDYLEVPLMVRAPPQGQSGELEWPRQDELQPLTFTDGRHVTFTGPAGKPITLDIEQLRTDPRWLEARARRRQAEKQERDEEDRRLRNIQAHNARASVVAKQLETTGLTCPYCSAQGKNFRALSGTRVERAVIQCVACGRALPI